MPETLVWTPAEARSQDYAAILAMPAVLAACVSFQDLIDGKTGADAQAHVQPGYDNDPWTGEATRDDLDNLLCRAWVTPHKTKPSQSQYTAAFGSCPMSSFALIMRIRRQIREADLGASINGLAGVMNYLGDRFASLRYEVVEQCQTQSGPVYDIQLCELVEWGEASGDKEAAQGPHAVADYVLQFGRPTEA